MKIIRTRPAPRDGVAIAYADVEVAEGVVLLGLRVEQRPDKTFRVYSPNAMGRRTGAFTPAAVNQIAQAVLSFHSSEPSPNDTTSHR